MNDETRRTEIRTHYQLPPVEPPAVLLDPVVMPAVSAAAPEPAVPVEPLPDTKDQELEKAAALVLSMLPGPIAEQIKEMSYVFNRFPLWVTVAGLVLRCYENGEHQSPILEPSWPRVFNNLPMDPLKQEYACEQCQQTFMPRRYRQRFCSNDCGLAFQKKVAVVV